MRFLIIGAGEYPERMTNALSSAGHDTLAVGAFDDAKEALAVQKFDAVLLSPSVTPEEAAAFTGMVAELDSQPAAASRTAVLRVQADGSMSERKLTHVSGLDHSVSETLDPESLTEAIVRLAHAVGREHYAGASDVQPDLPILDIEELKEQVAHDYELLVELIDLYFSERLKQSVQMREALAHGEHDRLSAVAHTLKGSLASLRAMRARAAAQIVESAAKERDDAKCRQFLPRLEQELNVLEERLLDLKQALTGL